MTDASKFRKPPLSSSPLSGGPLSRRGFLSLASQSLALPLFARQQQSTKPSVRRSRPNVVLILTDDQRWDCLSCAGHPFLRTPHLDQIASEGARFANFFCTTSLCSPSRASFLSGLYAHSHRVLTNFTDYPANLPSYASILKATGYETAYIGKWHMGEQNDAPRPGFDYWASHKGQGKYYDTEFNINGTRQVLNGYYTSRVTELAEGWLKRPHQKPYLMILGHKAPHGLWIPEPQYKHALDGIPIHRPPTANDTGEGKPAWVRQRVKTWHGIDGPLYGAKDYSTFVRTYLETILSVDESVGLVYEALRHTGELDNTLLLFASDNGFMLGEHGAIDKRTMYEESIRIPLLARYPAVIPAGTVVSEMTLNIDVAPSILDICGAPPLPYAHGRSWKPLLGDAPRQWRKTWYYEYNYEREFPYTPNVRGVRTEEWKYIHYPNGDGRPDRYLAELYHLKSDPPETHNLIGSPDAQSTLNELRRELLRLQKEPGAPVDSMPVNPAILETLPEPSIR